MLVKAFASWVDRHAEFMERKYKTMQAASKWANSALAAALACWREEAAYQASVKERLSGAVGK